MHEIVLLDVGLFSNEVIYTNLQPVAVRVSSRAFDMFENDFTCQSINFSSPFYLKSLLIFPFFDF